MLQLIGSWFTVILPAVTLTLDNSNLAMGQDRFPVPLRGRKREWYLIKGCMKDLLDSSRERVAFMIFCVQWNPDFSNLQGKRNLVRDIGSSRNRRWHQITLYWPGIVWLWVSVQILTKYILFNVALDLYLQTKRNITEHMACRVCI